MGFILKTLLVLSLASILAIVDSSPDPADAVAVQANANSKVAPAESEAIAVTEEQRKKRTYHKLHHKPSKKTPKKGHGEKGKEGHVKPKKRRG